LTPPAAKIEDVSKRVRLRVHEQAFNQEKADRDRVAASKNPDDLYTFLKKYPSGSITSRPGK